MTFFLGKCTRHSNVPTISFINKYRPHLLLRAIAYSGNKKQKMGSCLVVVAAALILIPSDFTVNLYLTKHQVANINGSIEPQATTNPNATVPTATPDLISVPITKPSQQQNTSLTRDEAVNLSMPIIQHYAEENNRTISNVTAYTLNELTTNHIYRKSFTANGTAWYVIAGFIPVPDDSVSPFSAQPWVIGYEVVIMAETGKIADSE